MIPHLLPLNSSQVSESLTLFCGHVPKVLTKCFTIPVALSLDTTSIAGASTATTWIHGRTLIAVGGSPVVFEVSPVVGTAFVVTAGTAAGVYLIRLTILKIS